MSDKPPLLMLSSLTNRVYIVTAYKDLGEGRIEARTKFDVTDQFEALLPEPPTANAPPWTVPVSDHTPDVIYVPICVDCGQDVELAEADDGTFIHSAPPLDGPSE